MRIAVVRLLTLNEYGRANTDNILVLLSNIIGGGAGDYGRSDTYCSNRPPMLHDARRVCELKFCSIPMLVCGCDLA